MPFFIFFFTALLKRRMQGDLYDSEEDEFIQNFYEIRKLRRYNCRKFNTVGRECSVHISDRAFPPGITFHECIDRICIVFKGIINDLLGHLPDHAYARIVIASDNLEANAPIATSYQRVRLLTPEVIITHISNVAQSKRAFILDGQMRIHLQYTIPPAGNGRKSDCVQLRQKRCIFSVCNDDNLCLGQSIVYGMEHIDNSMYIILFLKIILYLLQSFNNQLYR